MQPELEAALKRLARARKRRREESEAFKEELRKMEPDPLPEEPLPERPKASEPFRHIGTSPSEAYGPKGPYWKDKD